MKHYAPTEQRAELQRLQNRGVVDNLLRESVSRLSTPPTGSQPRRGMPEGSTRGRTSSLSYGSVDQSGIG